MFESYYKASKIKRDLESDPFLAGWLSGGGDGNNDKDNADWQERNAGYFVSFSDSPTNCERQYGWGQNRGEHSIFLRLSGPHSEKDSDRNESDYVAEEDFIFFGLGSVIKTTADRKKE